MQNINGFIALTLAVLILVHIALSVLQKKPTITLHSVIVIIVSVVGVVQTAQLAYLTYTGDEKFLGGLVDHRWMIIIGCVAILWVGIESIYKQFEPLFVKS